MAAVPQIPAAQYLRMSTDDQQYSISNQRIRIQEYALKKGFEIIQTYEDPGSTSCWTRKMRTNPACGGPPIRATSPMTKRMMIVRR
jgi:hypothetical protein